MIELLKYSHDRNIPYKKSCEQLRDIIDAFAEQTELEPWYLHFETHYKLPKDVVKQRMKAYIENLYHVQKCKWDYKLFPKKFSYSIMKSIAFLIYVLFWSRNNSSDLQKYDLMVEGNMHKVDLLWFTELMSKFGEDKTLAIALSPMHVRGFNVVLRPYYKYYDRREAWRIAAIELKCGWKLYAVLNRKLGINFGALALHIINQYLYYYSLFKSYSSKFCIQLRHYQTSSIKNHLFHQLGGLYSTSIQKNTHQLGRNGFYYDIDVLFSLGNKMVDRAFQYGAKIDQVVPVGSVFMEKNWFNSTKKQKFADKKYDIIYLGINASKAFHYIDAYASFKDDYYETFKWLAEFSNTYPQLKIGIKHHSDNIIDKRETEIIKDSNVERVDQRLNSYEVAFQSKCSVSFGSTMGYELIGHGCRFLYLDPGGRCAMLPDASDKKIRQYRAFSYEQFSDKILKILDTRKGNWISEYKDDFCLDSRNVTNRIYDWMHLHRG